MRRTGLVLSILLLATACQKEADGSETAAATDAAMSADLQDDASASAEPTEDAAPVAEGREVKVENNLFDFAYSYPDAAARYPTLKEMLDRKLVEARLALEAASRKDKHEADADGYPYRPHSSGTTWKVVTDLPGWLSLDAESYTYEGGAHGMTYASALVWDKQASVARKPADLFVAPAALRGAIRQPFCAALNAERAKRRGAPVDPNSGDEFDACIDPVESTLILGSANGATFDRIGVLVAPYDAGPYAEGQYEITLPVTDAVIAAVKPAYRSAFSKGQ